MILDRSVRSLATGHHFDANVLERIKLVFSAGSEQSLPCLGLGCLQLTLPLPPPAYARMHNHHDAQAHKLHGMA